MSFFHILLASGNALDTGSLIFLQTPFGMNVSYEFTGLYFVSKTQIEEADESIFLYYNNF